MGIDYTSSAAYGVIVNNDDKIIDLADRLGMFDDEDEEYTYWRDDVDLYEVLEFIAKHYGLQSFTAGDSYSGKVEYLIGEGVTARTFGWTKVLPPQLTYSTRDKLFNLISDLGSDEQPAWYAGLHIW